MRTQEPIQAPSSEALSLSISTDIPWFRPARGPHLRIQVLYELLLRNALESGYWEAVPGHGCSRQSSSTGLRLGWWRRQRSYW